MPFGVLAAKLAELNCQLGNLIGCFADALAQATLGIGVGRCVRVTLPFLKLISGLLDGVWQLQNPEPPLCCLVGLGHLRDEVLPAVFGYVVNAAHRPAMACTAVAVVFDSLVNQREPRGHLTEHESAATGHKPLQVVPVLAHGHSLVHVLQHELTFLVSDEGEIARSAHGGSHDFLVVVRFLEIKIPFLQMILWTSWFHIKDEEHRNEVLRSIEVNLENPYIEKLKLLCEIEFPHKHPKLECIPITVRPTYQTFTDMFDLGDINTIANSDIVFDYASTAKINQIKPNNAYCITRYQLESDYRRPVSEWKGTFWQEVSGVSQDAWVIYKPIRKIIADLYPGVLGCENRFTLSMHQAGLKLLNHGPAIKIFHVHASSERNYALTYHDQNYPGMQVGESSTRYFWNKLPKIWYTKNVGTGVNLGEWHLLR